MVPWGHSRRAPCLCNSLLVPLHQPLKYQQHSKQHQFRGTWLHAKLLGHHTLTRMLIIVLAHRSPSYLRIAMSLHYCQGNHLKIKIMLNNSKMVTLSTEFFSRPSLICYLQTQFCKLHGRSNFTCLFYKLGEGDASKSTARINGGFGTWTWVLGSLLVLVPGSLLVFPPDRSLS